MSHNYLHIGAFFTLDTYHLFLLFFTGSVFFFHFPGQSLFSSVLLVSFVLWFALWLVPRSSDLFLGQVEYETFFLFTQLDRHIDMAKIVMFQINGQGLH